MRVGCGSATIGMFARQWLGHADEVIVVDDHITGVLSEHQAGRFLSMQPAGIQVRGRKSTPGRYFRVAEPGSGWGGTNIQDPLDIVESVDPERAWPGLRMLMVSTTGEQSAWYVLDDRLVPQPAPMPDVIAKAVAPYGLLAEDIPDTMDLFMNYHHDCAKGHWVIGEPVSKPGDYIEFEALMDCVVGLSNCPMDVLAPCNAYHCTPVKVDIFEAK